jgi:hypothetical protein
MMAAANPESSHKGDASGHAVRQLAKRAPAFALQRACACGESAGVAGQCPACAVDERLGVQPKLGERLQTQRGTSGSSVATRASGAAGATVATGASVPAGASVATGASVAARASAAAAAVSSGGQPLNRGARAFFEPRFGLDLSHVRLHTDANAARAATSIDARAFTLGNHIAFAAAEYQPDTAQGRRLIAHELTHTLQQTVAARRTIQRAPAIDATPHNTDACACLVHVHNDERNAKAVANLLQSTCDYNLLQISPDNRSRNLDSHVRLPNGRRENDPNQFFDHDLVSACEMAIASGCDPLTTACPNTGNFSCEFYAHVRRCSGAFSVPVVALHNNVDTDTRQYRRSLGRRGGPTVGPQLFGTGKTNIHQWCRSPAISRCLVGDRDHPDHVIWTSNEADFLRLAGSPGVNVALQDRAFTDEDLSSLFNVLPDIQLRQLILGLVLPIDLSNGLPGNANDYRYINIETPHRPGRFDTDLAVDNFMFVTSVLKRLGLACCDEDQLRNLRENETTLQQRLTETNETVVSDEQDNE